jgi:hypothetical protein
MEAHMKVLVLLVAVFLLFGCGSTGRVDRAIASVDPEETVFVIGVKPAQANITVVAGFLKNGAFRQDPSAGEAFVGHPDHGFIIGKAPAGALLAIERVRWVEPGSMALGRNVYIACGMGIQTMVFASPKGKVVYVADLEIEPGTTTSITRRRNFEQARKYFDEHYPALKGRLEQQDSEIVPVARSCQTVELLLSQR